MGDIVEPRRDAQSVKNTDCVQNKGYDVGKKVSGIKRHSRPSG